MKNAKPSVTLGLGLMFLAMAAWWSGCATTSAPPAPSNPPTAFDPSILREGDVIQITFPGATNLNKGQLMLPQGGMLKLDYVDEIKATGRTPKELQDDILTAYGNALVLREVTVTVLQTSARVYVNGEVLRPGPVAMNRPLTALEAIMEAGGFTPQALPSQVGLLRKEDGVQQPYTLDLRKALRGLATNPVYLQPDDIITVPRKTFNL
jgi:polysaccharide export outer membrane protein